jgi:hypothetical protein
LFGKTVEDGGSFSIRAVGAAGKKALDQSQGQLGMLRPALAFGSLPRKSRGVGVRLAFAKIEGSSRERRIGQIGADVEFRFVGAHIEDSRKN